MIENITEVILQGAPQDRSNLVAEVVAAVLFAGTGVGLLVKRK